jgi:hypothetical protein
VGGKRPLPVNIRVIATTHRNLQEMINQGNFREDLWYRLSGFPITVPPLRQRKEDVPALTRHFMAVKSRELGLGYMKGKSAIHIARTYLGQRKNFSGMSFWASGYFITTVGADEETERTYIIDQEREDRRVEQLTLFK